jgi:hypothetical protein
LFPLLAQGCAHAAPSFRCDANLALRSGAVSRLLPSLHDHSLPAAPGRARRLAATALQPARRGGALPVSVGEAGEAEEAGKVCRGAVFNRVAELQSLDACLAGDPTAVFVLTGPPSCGKSGARALSLSLRVVLTEDPCSAAQATCCERQAVSAADRHRLPRWRCVLHPRACAKLLLTCGGLYRRSLCTDYTNPAAFTTNLVKCLQNDWQLDDKWLLSVFPSVAAVTGSAVGAEVDIEFRKAVQNEPRTALQKIMDAYLKLVKDAKAKRKEGEPWPVIIIDEANRLRGWKDEESLDWLLAFFVYISKQEQLAHVILATSDTFLTQWLESGAPGLRLRCDSFKFSLLSACAHRSNQRPVPQYFRAGQLVARGGAHVLLRLRPAVP